MIAWIVEWWPWILSVLLSGIFNLLVAYRKLYRDCRSPFFNPWCSWGFWLWVLVQMFLPGLIFYFYAKISSKPTVDFSLYWTAILVGFFFTVFVNANADLGFTSFSIDKLEIFLNKLAYDLIAAEQTGKITDFKIDLDREMLQNQIGLNEGLNWLKEYFASDIALSREELNKRIEEVDRALAKSTNEEKARAAIALVLWVRRKDYLRMLKRFKCSDEFIKTYFPKG
jgi:hypothetical protein